MTKEEVVRPVAHLTITVETSKGLENRRLFMSAALLRLLVMDVSGAADITSIITDPVLQNTLITRVVRAGISREKFFELSKEDSEFIDNMSIEESEKVLNWIEAHVTDFFIRAVAQLEKSAITETGGIRKLTDSMSGLADLVQPKQSVGPTEQK